MDVSTDIQWEVFNQIAISDANAIHIFKLEADLYYKGIQHQYMNFLSVAEIAKARRFLNEADRKRYIATKHALRCLLSTFTGIPADLIEFNCKGNKKPTISEIEFNVSHSGKFILIAIATLPLGIDIEMVNPDFDYLELIDSCFSQQERAFINSPKDFYYLWTRKEALLKATGEGLTEDLNEVACIDQFTVRHGVEYEMSTFTTGQYIFSLSIPSGDRNLFFWSFNASSFTYFKTKE